jgi:leucine-rich repeat-containing protein 49|tara:strand:+ start:135 stop:434 length:300 start_codon:yes stop_codon:yes gene_type:complete
MAAMCRWGELSHHRRGLPNLIFLDLYNNAIEQISGLSPVPTLRVLMLGKNRLSRIEGLEVLPKLDVLDLHCNRIRTIEGLSHLAELVGVILYYSLLTRL